MQTFDQFLHQTQELGSHIHWGELNSRLAARHVACTGKGVEVVALRRNPRTGDKTLLNLAKRKAERKRSFQHVPKDILGTEESHPPAGETSTLLLVARLPWSSGTVINLREQKQKEG